METEIVQNNTAPNIKTHFGNQSYIYILNVLYIQICLYLQKRFGQKKSERKKSV